MEWEIAYYSGDLQQAILAFPAGLQARYIHLTERMLTYALGRGLEPQDMPVVRRIVRDAGASDYRFMSIVMGIVESAPFQMRVKAAPATPIEAQRASAVR